MSASLKHASLGEVKGIRPSQHPAVEQYLGIKYAELADAFARGTPVDKPQTSVDATATGPLPIADPKNCDNEHLLFQHALPHPDYKFSATECLTLNITVPASSKTSGPLPVIALVHGGGFVTGSANWPQYDLAGLVDRSEQLGQPVVAVGINYRIGPFGFLTSSALQAAGYKANNGLDDQRLALQWVQKHIAGFGGDPSKVTFLGSSAGAASGFFHLQSPDPLFTQLIALGGSPLIQPLPPPVAEIAWTIATGALGLGALPPAEQVQALLALPPTELSTKLAGVPFPLAPIIDGEHVKFAPSYAALADTAALATRFPGVAAGCKTVVMGDAQNDGMVIGLALAGRPDNLGASLTRCLEAVLAPNAAAAAVVAGYGIDPARDDVTRRVLEFINDIGFTIGTRATAEAWAAAGPALGTKAYLAHVNMPNPWEGPWKGHATHALDVVLALGTYNAFLSEGQRAMAEQFGGDLISFAHGKEPFPPFSGKADGTAKVYFAGADSKKDESRVVSSLDKSATGRREILDKVAGGDPAIMDKLLGAFGMLMQGPPK